MAVYVAISMMVVFGMAALAIDIGTLYSAQSELQRSADAAALAAASQLVAEDAGDDPEQRARDEAETYANLNTVMNEGTVLMDADVEIGRAVYQAESGRFKFEVASSSQDAVRVTVKRTDDSLSGPIQLAFSRLFGVESRGLEARAAAVLVPRDIAVVIDLSNSMNWDSQLRFWDRNDGGYANTRDIWAALNGPEPSRPYMPGSELDTEYASDTGPSYGLMNSWGSPLLPGTYNPSTDAGLYYIRKNYTFSDSTVSASLAARGYSSDERTILMSGSNDSNTDHYRNRVGVLLNLATWRSGRTGGLYKTGGDGDNKVENGETLWIVTPNFSNNWSWKDYIAWVENGSLYKNDLTAFRYRYGLKTLVDYVLEQEPMSSQTGGLWATPQQPLRAVKDAVQTMTNVIAALESLDHISMEIFATTSKHEVNLSADLQAVPDKLYLRQSGHYDRATNIAGGLAQAIIELQSSRARSAATKTIILMSDGVANTDEEGNNLGDYSPVARQLALDRAQQAADLGFTVYTVSVGYEVDRPLLQEIAAIGHGQEFYAVGSPEEYSEQLELIFRALGGKRSVTLIE